MNWYHISDVKSSGSAEGKNSYTSVKKRQSISILLDIQIRFQGLYEKGFADPSLEVTFVATSEDFEVR